MFFVNTKTLQFHGGEMPSGPDFVEWPDLPGDGKEWIPDLETKGWKKNPNFVPVLDITPDYVNLNNVSYTQTHNIMTASTVDEMRNAILELLGL